MILKDDIGLYKKGNRAAEMRLASFVIECEKRLDNQSLEPLLHIGGKVEKVARYTSTKIKEQLIRNNSQRKIKETIKSYLDLIEYSGFYTDPAATSKTWIPLLKQASELRWNMQSNQEAYNIDLRIRRMIELANKVGIKI